MAATSYCIIDKNTVCLDKNTAFIRILDSEDAECCRRRKDRCCCLTSGGRGTTAGGGDESYLGAVNWIKGRKGRSACNECRSREKGKANKAN